MAKKDDIQITDSSDEVALENFLRDADLIRIPIFQRGYSWGKSQFEDLCSDILQIQDTTENAQFLGAIVSYEAERIEHISGRPKIIDVVDGQQRLITLYFFVLAICERLFFYDPIDAAETIQQYLLLPHRRGLDINTRVIPSLQDRSQFRVLWDRVNSPEVMESHLAGNPPRPPSASGPATGNIVNQYERIIKWLKASSPKEPTAAKEYLKHTLDILTTRLTFVAIKLTDASVATKIFERLNYRGIKVNIGDLVRNEVFSRFDSQVDTDLELYQSVWRPFEARLEGRSEAFYFAYCLIHNSNIKKSELFRELREIWGKLSPKEVVNHMLPYQSVFLQIVGNTPKYEDKELNLLLIRLNRVRVPSAMYPFIMQVLRKMEINELPVGSAKQILHYLEAFYVRRAVLGFEPTGLHSLFKGLWNDIQASPNLKSVKAEISKRTTIQAPSDPEVINAIASRPLASAKICPYLLSEYDKHLPGDNPSDNPTIEHILPQSYEEGSVWSNDFTKEEHKKYKDIFANLIPLSSPLNTSLQRSPYDIKSKRYLEESMYVTPRKLAQQWSVWTPKELDERTLELCSWFVSRWPE
jgi:hypothetical protein